MNGEYFFRLKLSYKGYDDQGGIVPVKEENLAMCVNYADAECIALALLDEVEKFDDDSASYEVIKTKIQEVVFNDTFQVDNNMVKGLIPYFFSEDETTETGLYAVSVIFYLIDEKTGKESKKTDTIYVPAATSVEAVENLRTYFRKIGENNDFVVRNVKYDKAQQVFVTPQQHEHNTSETL